MQVRTTSQREMHKVKEILRDVLLLTFILCVVYYFLSQLNTTKWLLVKAGYMANQEHVAILKQGVEAWNMWRREHPDIQPDLSFGCFIRTDLSGANFKRARLNRATLTSNAPIGNDF